MGHTLTTAIGMWGFVVIISPLAAAYVARLTPERLFYPAIVSESLYGLISLLFIHMTGGVTAYSVLSGVLPYKLGLAASVTISLSLFMGSLAHRSDYYEPPTCPRAPRRERCSCSSWRPSRGDALQRPAGAWERT